MYIPLYSNKFKKSYNKLRKSKTISRVEVEVVVSMIAKGEILPIKYRDHKLQGEQNDCRECHVKPNVLLVYKINKNNQLLDLLNIGSHSELFG